MEIQPRGDLMNMKVKGIGSEIVMENIRIPAQVRGYFPYNHNLSGSEKLVKKMTSGNSPSTCSLENGHVKTFDNVEYEYGLNHCEHIVFKDCTESSRVEVTVQKMSHSKKIKVTIDNHVYEVDIPNQGTQASIKINGETKSYVTKSEQEGGSNSDFIALENNNYDYEVVVPIKASIKIDGETNSSVTKSQQEGGSNSEFIALEDNYYQDSNTFV